MFILGMYASYKKLLNSKIEISDKELVSMVVNESFETGDNLLERLVDTTLKYSNPIKLLNKNYKKYATNDKKVVNEKRVTVNEEVAPLIYIYNSHQTEEYASSNYAEFSINPTVVMNNYILEDMFLKRGYKSLVEERSIKEVLNQNNWKYANSYKASRIFLEDVIIKQPSLKYFIDVHRDSLKRDKTVVNIEGKDYAKIIYLIGEENPNFQENLKLTEKINSKMQELYPGLSKGIYKKSGPGVNGVYNQDFSPNLLVVEVGGYENTTTEVMNSAIAFAICFMEVINE